MRRTVSVALLLATLAGMGIGLWKFGREVSEAVSSWWLVEDKTWVEKPAMSVSIVLTGPTLHAIEPASKRITTLLYPFDGRMKKVSGDSPAARIELTAILPPPVVLPLRDLVQKMIHTEDTAGLARRRHPARGVKKSKSIRKPAARLASTAASQAWIDLKRRKDNLMKAWAEAEKNHARTMESRQEFRHPEELLKTDVEAVELKRKLVDLEMTLAEVIDHYTLVHPRVKELQREISAVRSSLDRRVMVAESEEQDRWKRRMAEFKRKKAALDREEKQLASKAFTSAPRPARSEPVERTVEEVDPEPPPLPSIQMAWTENQTHLRELVTVKRIDPQTLSIGLAAMSAAGLLLGYLFGLIGQASSAPVPSLGARHAPALDEGTAVKPSAEPQVGSKIRKPLPPIASPPVPAPPGKMIEESDLPGVSWLTVPTLPAVEKGLYTVFAPTSPAAEIFSNAAADLIAKLPKSDGSQVISVAAIRSGGGTTTWAANLAVALASRRPVVLMDLHHTAPHLHTFFSLQATAADLMASAPWSQSTLQTPVDRVSLLPLFSPHTEKEMADLKFKKRFQPFLKENPVGRIILIDVAPLGRSELFEEIAEWSDLFLLIHGPDPVPATAKDALKRLAKAMKKKPILRLTRSAQLLPDALAARPPAAFEFVG